MKTKFKQGDKVVLEDINVYRSHMGFPAIVENLSGIELTVERFDGHYPINDNERIELYRLVGTNVTREWNDKKHDTVSIPISELIIPVTAMRLAKNTMAIVDEEIETYTRMLNNCKENLAKEPDTTPDAVVAEYERTIQYFARFVNTLKKIKKNIN